VSAPTEGDFEKKSLASLNARKLTEARATTIYYNGLKTEVEEATRDFLKRGGVGRRVLNDASVERACASSESIFATASVRARGGTAGRKSMKGGMEILCAPCWRKTEWSRFGKIVIGTGSKATCTTSA